MNNTHPIIGRSLIRMLDLYTRRPDTNGKRPKQRNQNIAIGMGSSRVRSLYIMGDALIRLLLWLSLYTRFPENNGARRKR